MSAGTRPISPSRFIEAIKDLPIENIYAKAHEIENSVAHLERSNAQLQEYSDSIKNDTSLEENVRAEGDKDCLDAIRENNIVISRQLDRVDLLKQEVERRGARWHEAEPRRETVTNGVPTNGHTTGEVANAPAAPPPSTGGRLTDEELRRRLEEQMGGDEDDDGGMHL